MNTRPHLPATIVAPSETRFRFGLIPATVLFFIAVLASCYAAMVIPNVFRDALNGYDILYIITSSAFPASLIGLSICCIVVGRSLVLGKRLNAVATVIPAAACVMIAGILVAMLR